MILAIILLILIILTVSILLLFLFYILLPSIHAQKEIHEDPVVSNNEIEYIKPVIEKTEASDMKALVLCSCEKSFNTERDSFNEGYSCALVKEYSGTGCDCKYACIGLGDCTKVCEQEAIIIKNRTAVITKLCIGCGKCVQVCPQQIIRLVPKNTEEYTLCSNTSDDKSSCTQELKTQKVLWNEKKDFKIWQTCYKIFEQIIKN